MVAEGEADLATTDTLETDTTTDGLLPLDTTTVDTKRTTTDDPLLPDTTTEIDSPEAAPLVVSEVDTEVSEVATVAAGMMIGTESDTLLPETTEDPLLLEMLVTCESPGTPTETEAIVVESGTADLPHESGSSEVSMELETTTDLKLLVTAPDYPPTQTQTQIYDRPPEAVPTELHPTCTSDVRLSTSIRLLHCSFPFDSTYLPCLRSFLPMK